MAFTGYKVARADDLSGLERAVLALAADGYVPYGPSGQEDDGSFLQTMIKGDVAGGATSLNASAVDVAAGTDGLADGTAQDTLQDVYTKLALPTPAANVSVDAGTDGLAAGTAQEALQALATRVFALENP